MRIHGVIACVLVVAALVAGCRSDIQGTPVTTSSAPTEPSFPTSRPSTSRPTPTPSATAMPSPSAPGPASPPAAQVLPPDDSGYVFVQTKSGQTRCQLNQQEVDCEAQFANAPTKNGQQAHGVRVTAGGTMEWVVGNLGDIPAVTLDYRTYSAVGWTIMATSDGTRFTNQRTNHGMFVSIDKVESY